MTPFLSQVKRLAPFLAMLYTPPMLVLSAVAAASLQTGLSPFNFMRDPAQIANVHPFIGVVSNLGAFLWCAAAAICMFAWAILKDQKNHAEFSRFLFFSGLFTMVLLIDDFFVFHDKILPYYFGIGEKTFFPVYALLTLAGLVFFRRTIATADYILLIVALGLLALSLAVDAVQFMIQRTVGEWRILLEDGLKFLGIAGWFGFFAHSCFSRIRAALATPK